ncbi:hypothetical protein PYCC9005_003177 [Savitreella phatthalungensis]
MSRRSRFDAGGSAQDRIKADTDLTIEQPDAKRQRRSQSPAPEHESPASGSSQMKAPDTYEDVAATAKRKAAEAAARLTALLAKKKPQEATKGTSVRTTAPLSTPVPPPPPPPLATHSGLSAVTAAVAARDEPIDENGHYFKDIEVNDLRNRYLVLKEATLQDIRSKTGATIEVRGKYYPDKSQATEQHPPMYLHIAAEASKSMEAAVGMVKRLINSELGPLVDERRFRRRDDIERDELGRPKWPEEKVPVDIPQVRGFHVRAAIVGSGGENVKYIQSETRTRIQLKGHGSGYEETSTGREAEEPMFLHITGPDPAEVSRATGMVQDLITSVLEKYEEWRQGEALHNGSSGSGYRDRGYSDHRDGSFSPGSRSRRYETSQSPNTTSATQKGHQYHDTRYGGGLSSRFVPATAAKASPPPPPPPPVAIERTNAGAYQTPPPPSGLGPASGFNGGTSSRAALYPPPPPRVSSNANGQNASRPPPPPPGRPAPPFAYSTAPAGASRPPPPPPPPGR